MPLIHQFNQDLAWLYSPEFELPFEFGAATQCGKLNDHNNNQDSIAIVGNGKQVVGVVCDGCTSSNNGFSNNEVGSRLISVLITRLVWDLLDKGSFARIPKKLSKLEKKIGRNLLDISKYFVEPDVRQVFLESFFMSTILVFAVDEEDYFIFGCGDGFFSVNCEINSLDKGEGEYLTNHLIKEADYISKSDDKIRSLKLYAQGKTNNLNSLLLATDGFFDLYDQFPVLIQKFMGSSDETKIRKGYNQLMAAQFRRCVWFQPIVEDWAEMQNAHDDRSFLLLRRIPIYKEEETVLCSKSPKNKQRKQEVFSEP